MPEGHVRTLTMREFRRLDSLSGELRVVGGSRRRRGVRRPHRRASCKSSVVLAGTDATSRGAVGGSTQPLIAHAACRATNAAPAKPKADKRRRPPELNDGKIRLRFADEPLEPRIAASDKHEVINLAKQNDKKQKNSPPGKSKSAPQPKSSDGEGGDRKPIESLWDERVHLDGGDDLPADGPAFVDAVNEYVNLVRLTDSLLRERDEKSSKSLLEKLLEMKYGKSGKAEAVGVRPIICDLPGPVRD